jgi:hypothetical protein
MGGRNNKKLMSPSTTYDNAGAKKQKASVKALSSSSLLSARFITNNDNILINNKKGLLFASVKFMDLPVPIRVCILNYLGQTQNELMNLTLVSKQVYEDCKRNGIEWKIIPTINLIESQHPFDGTVRALRLLQNLHQHLQNNNETKDKLQCYRHMTIKDVSKFYVSSDNTQFHHEVQDITRGIQMGGILSLDISSSRPPSNHIYNSFT